MSADKTDLILSEVKEILNKHLSAGYLLGHNRLIGEIDHFIKIKALRECSSIQSAAVQLGLKRTTLAEYMRKIGVKIEDIRNGNY